jgi:hypothetical protein
MLWIACGIAAFWGIFALWLYGEYLIRKAS